MDNKIKTITNLFEGSEIRSIWNREEEEYYFSVVDVISVLTNSPRPRKYWNALKTQLISEGSQLSQKVGQLKMTARDGKNYLTDVLDTEGILRLIESVPSPKAEPFKMWLATLGKERIDEVFDPEIAVNRAIEYYRKKGFDDEWIRHRLFGILNRKKLTETWKKGGITENYEYALLTDEIYKTWSGMKASEYKSFKGIRKESLRDNMSEIEIVLTDLSEIATNEISKASNPQGLKENMKVAKEGGQIAKGAKDALEQKINKSVIENKNKLNYKYIDENISKIQ